MSPETRLIITCEHGGREVPRPWAELFRGREELLSSHRGYDPGALELARELAAGLGAPLFFSTVTRLLIDLNRSPGNPRRFSEITAFLGPEEKETIEAGHYRPYREEVEKEIRRRTGRGGRVVHISVHSFTPVLDGAARNAGLGLLYDPSRGAEAAFCRAWRKALLGLDPALRIRRNYPYRGSADGLTTHLRRLFPEDSYIGIELEVNQRFPLESGAPWRELQRLIPISLRQLI